MQAGDECQRHVHACTKMVVTQDIAVEKRAHLSDVIENIEPSGPQLLYTDGKGA